MPVPVSRIMDALESLAPLRYAAEWDNVGLLIGSTQANVDRVLLTIDLTEPVLDEAVKMKADMVIAYHPPIFQPVRTLVAEQPESRIALEAARRGINVYSPHTALDAAPGGVNDWIAAGLGEGDRQSLEHYAELPQSEECKVVTFAPADAAGKIRDALSTIGAGRIGDYEQCSFEIRGTGTFLGGESTNPVVGQRGMLERVDEIRLEMVCPRAALALAIMTLREFHPYEEPPVEIYPLLPRPQRNIGQGRRLVLDQKVGLRTIARRLKHALGTERLRVAASPVGPDTVGIIGICAGAGGSLLKTAIQRGCHLFVTGELKHHDILAALAEGCSVIVAGHTNTERGYLPTLQSRLSEALDNVEFAISARDCDPLEPI